ncbi:hypothetical protein CK203_115002 [Vitis vinifera]|uniref:Uncharacterized protein n=1 Tax=Vitis vinifera TaxID=29760 RepID=A0A438CE62_VITVI|nr:hypothetical protein CK203_115002 [Vitis vinifera]
MKHIRGGHTNPSISRETRLRASSPQDSSQVPHAPTAPSSEGERPSYIAPEAIIKRPMVITPPIEGNSYCRAKPFHSELYFEIEAMRQQPKLQDSFGPL